MALRGCEIGVIGAGIGGLAAALALARRGARVRVFEQAERLGEIGAGIQLGPNAVAVLEALGRRDAVAAQASAPAAIELRDHRGGRLVARVPLGQTTVARYGRPYWHLHRADLLAALTAGVVEAGGEIGSARASRRWRLAAGACVSPARSSTWWWRRTGCVRDSGRPGSLPARPATPATSPGAAPSRPTGCRPAYSRMPPA